MSFVGAVVRLQVQKSSLKAGSGKSRWYDPEPIISVPAVSVTMDGVRGIDGTGDEIVDVHNAQHPDSKNRRLTNGVSIGFTSHYRAMRARFGVHLVDGIAGENILIDVDTMVSLDDFPPELVLRSSDGEEIRLTDIVVAAPCVEFSRFALGYAQEQKTDRAVTEAVQFLNDGMRGFYAKLSSPGPARISVGDVVAG